MPSSSKISTVASSGASCCAARSAHLLYESFRRLPGIPRILRSLSVIVGPHGCLQHPLEPIERAHGWQHLPHTGVRLPLLPDGGEELTVLQLDAVHGHIDVRDIDGLLMAIE